MAISESRFSGEQPMEDSKGLDAVTEAIGYLQIARDLREHRDLRTGLVSDIDIANRGAVFIVNPEELVDQERERRRNEIISVEEAQEILGDDFFGEEHLRIMQRVMEPNISITDIQPSSVRLFRADVEHARDNGERLFILPAEFDLDLATIEDMTLANIMGITTPIFTEKRTEIPSWLRDQSFMTDPQRELPFNAIYISKDPILEARGKSEIEQNSVVEQQGASLSHAKRDQIRIPTLSEWMLAYIIYYTNTGYSLTESNVLTSTRTEKGDPVYFGGANSDGFTIQYASKDDIRSFADVHTVR